jgi:hypothetical protein
MKMMNEFYISEDIETDGPIRDHHRSIFCGAASIFLHRRKHYNTNSQRGISGRVAILILGFLCSSFQSSRNAIAQIALPTDGPPHLERLMTCPPKSPQGATFVEMAIIFSIERPMQDVTCLYSDGYRSKFEVEKGCDVEPTGIIADAVGPRGSGFTQGRHQCLESAGAGKCHIVCRH